MSVPSSICEICGFHRSSKQHLATRVKCSKSAQILHANDIRTPPPENKVLPFKSKRNANGSISRSEFY